MPRPPCLVSERRRVALTSWHARRGPALPIRLLVDSPNRRDKVAILRSPSITQRRRRAAAPLLSDVADESSEDGMTYAEAAGLLGLTPDGVAKRAARGQLRPAGARRVDRRQVEVQRADLLARLTATDARSRDRQKAATPSSSADSGPASRHWTRRSRRPTATRPSGTAGARRRASQGRRLPRCAGGADGRRAGPRREAHWPLTRRAVHTRIGPCGAGRAQAPRARPPRGPGTESAVLARTPGSGPVCQRQAASPEYTSASNTVISLRGVLSRT